LDVRRTLGDRPVRFAHNADYLLGMASSVKCGVRCLSEHTRGFVLALVDQPQISLDVINHVIETFENQRALIVVPVYGGKNGHPVLLDISLKDEILALDDQQGLRDVVHAHRDAVARVEMSNSAVLEDFDLPEDYERISKL
jgi:molybdenum cofactor cytidylyltransferase